MNPSILVVVYGCLWLAAPPALLNTFLSYSTSGGSLLSKIHPASYFLILYIVLARVAAGSPISYRLGGKERTFLLLCLLCVITTLSLGRFALLATFLDIAFVPSVVYYIGLRYMSPESRQWACRALAIFIVGLSLTVWVEKVLGIRFLELDGYDPFNRPSGWFAHPLAAGMVLLIGMILLAHSGMSKATVAGGAIFLFITIVLTGTRGPLIAGIFALIGIGVTVISSKGVLPKVVVISAIGLSLMLALGVAEGMGLLTRFQYLGFSDDSTEARLSLFGVLDLLTPSEWLFGIASYDVIIDLAFSVVGVPYVENALILVLMQGGLLVTALYFSVVLLVLAPPCRGSVLLLMICVVAFIGTISMAVKAAVLPLLITTGMLLLPQSSGKESRYEST